MLRVMLKPALCFGLNTGERRRPINWPELESPPAGGRGARPVGVGSVSGGFFEAKKHRPQFDSQTEAAQATSFQSKISSKFWPELESNQRHKDFQSSALPTELSGHKNQLS